MGMKNDPATGTLKPFDFSGIYDEFPSLRRLNVDIRVKTLSPIDSSNVTPEMWAELAQMIRDSYAEHDGFVVLHGTDTMSYTSAALSFMLENLAKPIVFTGSQIPIGVLRTDGRENLITAIEIASATTTEGLPMVPEVTLYFQNRLYRANRTTKHDAEALSAFDSSNYPPIAEVGVNIDYRHALIHRPSGGVEEPLRIRTDMERGVCIVKIFPGINEPTLRGMLGIEGLRGIVLETFGAGNAPTNEWFLSALEDVIGRGVYVVNVTQCIGGAVDMDIYETGQRLHKIGVLSGRDITSEAAITKLMYVLGLGLSAEQTRQELKKSIRGEINMG